MSNSLVVVSLVLGAFLAPKEPVVMTTFHPTTYFVQRIAKDRVTVRCPLPEGADPAFWIPPREVVAEYQAADLVIVNGADLEKWIATASLRTSRLVDVSKPFSDSFLRIENAVTHSHGAAGEHSHEGLDGHTWLDPENARTQAKEILKALERLFPGDAAAREEFAANHAALDADLAALDAGHRARGKQKGGALYASHPAYNYLARRYGWKVVNLDLDPGEMPSDEKFAALRFGLGERPGRFLLWESEPSEEIRERMKSELGLESIVVDPAENPSAQDRASGLDFLTIQKRNLERLAACFEPAQ